MAGAYDLSGTTLQDALSGGRCPTRITSACCWRISGRVSFRGFAGGCAGVAVRHDPCRAVDGTNSSSQINAAMPSVVTNAFKPEVVAALQNDRTTLACGAAENDLHRWTPQAPMRLYHCGGDQDVVPANSQVAYDSFRARGANQSS